MKDPKKIVFWTLFIIILITWLVAVVTEFGKHDIFDINKNPTPTQTVEVTRDPECNHIPDKMYNSDWIIWQDLCIINDKGDN